MIEKSELRKKFRALRSELPGHDDYLFLLDVPEIQSAKIVSSYFPMPGEPNLISLNDALIKMGKTLLLPRIVNDQMEFAKYDGHKSQLIARGKFHEPNGNIFIGEINVALIPSMAIDHKGLRLGQGGGYFDRFLVKTSAFRIGIIHDREFLKKPLPGEWFDQKVEAVATESGFRRIQS